MKTLLACLWFAGNVVNAFLLVALLLLAFGGHLAWLTFWCCAALYLVPAAVREYGLVPHE